MDALDSIRPVGPVVIDHDHFGPGYGKPTAACLEALRAAARLEGLILDPVYTGKALAGLPLSGRAFSRVLRLLSMSALSLGRLAASAWFVRASML